MKGDGFITTSPRFGAGSDGTVVAGPVVSGKENEGMGDKAETEGMAQLGGSRWCEAGETDKEMEEEEREETQTDLEKSVEGERDVPR